MELAAARVLATPAPDFAEAVLAGLAQTPKVVPARYFYDRTGSELFEAITRLPEYYPTRTEIGLLQRHGGDIAGHVGPGRVVVEFGSGSSAKTPLLLRAVAPAAYVPIDISAEFLADSAAALAAATPGLAVHPLAGDFTDPLILPAAVAGRSMLGFFPGSTLGNCTPAAAVDLLRSFAATLGEGAWLVIGLDLRKDRATVEAAYNDSAGVTAAFNLNLARRINAELGGTIDLAALRHVARWNGDAGRIEMHLEAVRDFGFTVLGRAFRMACGETIHTENSYKWTLDEARLLARASSWSPVVVWLDLQARFGLHLWRRAAAVMEP